MIKSTKFWMSAITVVCLTVIYGYAMYLGKTVPVEYTAFITGIATSFGGLKTYQNVMLSKNGGSE